MSRRNDTGLAASFLFILVFLILLTVPAAGANSTAGNETSSSPPSVAFVPPTPDSGSVRTNGFSFPVNISASDSDNVTKIQIHQYDGSGYVETVTATYGPKDTSFVTDIEVGPFEDDRIVFLNATAFDGEGLTASTATINVTVDLPGDDTPPEPHIRIIPDEPTENDTVQYLANATDDEWMGNVSVFVDGDRLVTCSDDPSNDADSNHAVIGSCGLTRGPYPAGSNHTYRAVAFDRANNSASTIARFFSISAGGGEDTASNATGKNFTEPSVWFAEPTPFSGTVRRTNESYSVNATATDVANITNLSIHVYNESRSHQWSTTASPASPTSPYTNAITVGPFFQGGLLYFNATAHDTDGVRGESSTINVTVDFSDVQDGGGNTTNLSETMNDTNQEQPPSIRVRAAPSQPTDTAVVTYVAHASDDTNIENVSIVVDDERTTCPDVRNESYACTAQGGPYQAGSIHTFYARAWDDSGLSARTPEHVLNASSVEGSASEVDQTGVDSLERETGNQTVEEPRNRSAEVAGNRSGRQGRGLDINAVVERIISSLLSLFG